MKHLLSTVIVTISIAVAGYAFGSTPSATDQAAQTAAAAVKATIEQSEFKGTIKKLDDGTALFTEKQIYPLLGGNFDTIIGKEVRIIGKLVKENDVEKISVAKVQFEKN